MSAGANTRLGVLLMVATTLIFSVQDGLSLHLLVHLQCLYGGYGALLVLCRFRDDRFSQASWRFAQCRHAPNSP
jgi:hypothetical protein